MAALRSRRQQIHPPSATRPTADDPAAAPARWLFLPTDRFFLIAKTPFIMGFGAYFAGATSVTPDLIAAMALASALWFCLYALNEASDAALEQHTPVARRPQVMLLVTALALAGGAAFVSPLLSLLLFLMVAAQAAYCLPPVRGKRHWEAAVLISGAINPVLRLQAGALFGAHAVPLEAYVAVLLLHLGGALRTRLLRHDRDRALGYRTAPEWLGFAGLAATMVGIGTIGVMSVQRVLPLVCLAGAAAAVPFAAYVWSRRAQDVSRLRRAWVLPAALLPAVFLLLHR